jgi:gamma-glutamylcyclotransferase
MTIYFAYGSNMLTVELRKRIPRASPIGRAYLSDYRLRFSRRSLVSKAGVVDVVAAPRMRTWGVLFDIPEDGVRKLDLKEGVGIGAYERHLVEVVQSGPAQVAAMTYMVSTKESLEVAPSATYIGQILEGAEEHGLPKSYLTFLRWIEKEALAATREDRPFREGSSCRRYR